MMRPSITSIQTSELILQEAEKNMNEVESNENNDHPKDVEQAATPAQSGTAVTSSTNDIKSTTRSYGSVDFLNSKPSNRASNGNNNNNNNRNDSNSKPIHDPKLLAQRQIERQWQLQQMAAAAHPRHRVVSLDRQVMPTPEDYANGSADEQEHDDDDYDGVEVVTSEDADDDYYDEYEESSSSDGESSYFSSAAFPGAATAHGTVEATAGLVSRSRNPSYQTHHEMTYSDDSDEMHSTDDEDDAAEYYTMAHTIATSYLNTSKHRNGGSSDTAHGNGNNNNNQPVLYFSRWIMLFYLALLNLLSDWTCYSIAPITTIVTQIYPGVNNEHLVTLFLACNAVSTVLEPMVLGRLGLRGTVILGSVLLLLGSWFKTIFFLGDVMAVDYDNGEELQQNYNGGAAAEDAVTNYIYLAFALVGLSQPLYQCTPAVLSSVWFGEEERTMATGIALNANQLGIGVSFVLGGLFVTEPERVQPYFELIFWVSLFCSIGVLIQFKDAPPTPPTAGFSMQAPVAVMEFESYQHNGVAPGVETQIRPTTPGHVEMDIRDDQVMLQVKACMLERQGFVQALVAFTASAIVINTLSTNFQALLLTSQTGYDSASDLAFDVSIFGGSFQMIIMTSSLIVGKSADITRAYYSVIVALLICGAFLLAECGIALDPYNGIDERWVLLVTAFFIGPLQPVSTEMGVDIVYPISENTVLCIQQLFANLCSSVIIPIFASLQNVGTANGARPKYYYSFYLLICIHAASTVYFSMFSGRYRRYEHEILRKQSSSGIVDGSFGSNTIV